MSTWTENDEVSQRTQFRIRYDMKMLNVESLKVVEELYLFRWDVTIKGPEDSPFTGHEYTMMVVFPADYPDNPPSLFMKTALYHPNMAGDTLTEFGKIRLDYLTPEFWSEDFTITDVFERLESVMRNPDLSEELVVNPEAARLCGKDREAWARSARNFC